MMYLQKTYFNQNSSHLLTGYYFFRKYRPNSKKGGCVCTRIKNNLSFLDINIPASVNDLEVITITVSGTLNVNSKTVHQTQ